MSHSTAYELTELRTRLQKSGLDSRLIDRLREASTKKLEDLTPEDLRLLISQRIGLEYLVPIALTLLEENPLCSGNLYVGDLASVLLDLPQSFWESQPALNNRMVEVGDSLTEIRSTLDTEILPKLSKMDFLS
ncbi:contact-dependent growth inhibition system immunity protein [Endozoicomonas arenosclerae]|uniref:contact-dependent growth inhibition system immunity protein n=1 Tax=Endozoicomonas arenosclerae TaxID=1633495 RepID=UPI00078148EE|nr:contact-dependent growth inhibition system immunity protein [Endozoicomonas arenosclerae]